MTKMNVRLFMPSVGKKELKSIQESFENNFQCFMGEKQIFISQLNESRKHLHKVENHLKQKSLNFHWICHIIKKLLINK